MAIHLNLCLILLVVSARNMLSSPVYTSELPPPTPPPSHILEDKGVNAPPAVDLDGNQIQCQNDGDCQNSVLGPDSRCSGHHCECKIGAVPSPTTKKCLGAVHNLGAGCEETWQCTRELGNQVQCKDHFCSCVEGSKVVDGHCKKQLPLSGQCESNDECAGGKNTTCTDGVCACILTMVPNAQNDRCLSIAVEFEDQCEETIQCSNSFGDGAKCHEYKCICSDDFHFNNHGCLKNLNLGDTCEGALKADCFLKSTGIERVECNQTCQCKGGYHPSSDKTECLSPGQPEHGTGDAASLSPIFAVIVSIMLARLVAS